MFAIITPALITGAFANRVSFKAYMLFLTLWLVFVYFPFAHMIWGGGLLQRWGVLDFAARDVARHTTNVLLDLSPGYSQSLPRCLVAGRAGERIGD